MPIENSTPNAPSGTFGQSRLPERVERAGEAAVSEARELRERAEDGLAEQRSLIAQRVRRFGSALRESSGQLREDELAQSMLERAGERVERAARYIDTAQPADVIEDLTTFARERPGLFFGGAFLVGLAVGRFAKSSQAHAYDGRAQPSESRSARQPAAHYQPLPTAQAAGGAHGLHYGAHDADEKPQPQPGDASAQARALEPGEGNKS